MSILLTGGLFIDILYKNLDTLNSVGCIYYVILMMCYFGIYLYLKINICFKS